jgi:Ohr subfamily peroxiredoxin
LKQETTMPVDVIYKTAATARGGRDGAVRSEDGSVDVKLVVPKEMGGPGGDGANPEKLFAAGYAACFLGAMKAVSGKVGVQVPANASVTAQVGFGPRSEGGYGVTADLTASLPGVDRADAERLMHAAHEVCPYSNATRGNLDVGLTVA